MKISKYFASGHVQYVYFTIPINRFWVSGKLNIAFQSLNSGFTLRHVSGRICPSNFRSIKNERKGRHSKQIDGYYINPIIVSFFVA